ncbi:5-methyltetrahydrofolate--homocysteine methyltransferase [Clostridium ljungdahlii]|uniref:5-methyltetrahydrofolate--homocysteine methyltransferase n=2 Tax=Clostridium ljungdahlii TaxID=1538 RepID=UPI00386769FB
MNIISSFKFQLNKDRVIKMVQSYGKMPQYNDLDKMYKNLLPILKDHSNPLGIFKMEEKDESINLNMLSKCKFTIYCLITLGEKCTNKINEMFENGNFYEALLLDSMSSNYLFNMSSQLHHIICSKASKINLGITHKVAPGDGEIELEYQNNILSKLKDAEFHNVKMVNNCVYPHKSLTYVYGADTSISVNGDDHCCSRCSNIFCSMRHIEKENNYAIEKAINCA